MAADQPSDARQRQSATFSLRTLFLIVTWAGVASVAFRIYAHDSFAEATALATVFVTAFLTLWFLATRQFKQMRSALAILAILLYLGIDISLLLPMHYRVTGQRDQCSNNLKQIGLALLAYQQRYGSFPPAYVADASGKPLYSWRTLILPELDNNNLAQKLRRDEAWDGPNNSKLTQTGLPAFGCPSELRSGGVPSGMTSYVAVVGPNTAWSGTTLRKLSDFKNPGGTILVVEIANSGINWAEPRDLYVGQMPLAINPPSGQGISSHHTGGVNAVFVDGSVHFLPDSISPKTLAELLDLDGCSDERAYQ